MSTIYEKSKSEKYGKYFTSEATLGKKLSHYSLENEKPLTSQTSLFHKWDKGTVGVPLCWNPEAKYVGVDHTDSHTLVIGPTGSKKSRLVVMPLVRILGSTGESMIISDPKAEIYNRTSVFLRENGYNVIVLNLRSPMHGNRWNPLSVPYEFYLHGNIDKACEFTNDIAQNIIRNKKSSSDPFWEDSAGSFFFGLVLLLFKYCRENKLDSSYVHIGNVIHLRNSLFTNVGRGVNRSLWDYAKEDYIIASALIGTVETANDTRGGILSTFDQQTRMFSVQPNVLDMLGGNDINIDSIGEERSAVFLIVPDEKTGYHGLVSLFVKQSYEYLIYKAQSTSEDDGFHVGILNNRLNYLLDEFSSLPTVQDFPAMVTAARSRNIRFTLVIQSKHQLMERYKDETDTIQTNCGNWIFLTSRETQLLDELSTICGKTIEDNPKPILSVSDLQRLDKDSGEALVLYGRLKPCISRLPDINFYDNDRFKTEPPKKREAQQPPFLPLIPTLEDANRSADNPFKISDKIFSPRLNIGDPSEKNSARLAKLEDEEEKKRNASDSSPEAPSETIDKIFSTPFNPDTLIKMIDAKIAELEAEEEREKARSESKQNNPTCDESPSISETNLCVGNEKTIENNEMANHNKGEDAE